MALLKTATGIWARIKGAHLKSNSSLRRITRCVNSDYRLRASTLMETLVATVLIVIVFMVSSLILNSLMMNKAKKNTELAEERIHALEYQYRNEGLELPYYEDFESWEITISRQQIGDKSLVAIEAENPTTKAVVTNYIAHED